MSAKKPKIEALGIVREFWRLMGTNDFKSVAAVLAPEFILDWPQSNERVRGADNFAVLNTECRLFVKGQPYMSWGIEDEVAKRMAIVQL